MGISVIVGELIEFEIRICQSENFNPFGQVDEHWFLGGADQIFNASIERLQVLGPVRFIHSLKTGQN